jgi:3-(3-hydroxy-phenyl)propionate hydroxylase
MAEKDRVVIAGGGPVGMVLALALKQRGVPVTVLESLDEPFVDQRAASQHPPTIAFMEQLGLAEHIIPEGLVAPVYRIRDRVTGDVIVEFDLGELADELPFPYVLQYEQYKLVFKIMALYGDDPDFDVRFSSAVAGFTQHADHVDIVVDHKENGRETIRASYLIGCDGGRSTVRKGADIGFDGFTYPELFIKIGTYYDFMQDDSRIAIRNYFSDPEEWCNLFKVNGEDGRSIWRGVFPMRIGETEEKAKRPETLEERLQKFFPKPGSYEIAYANVYTVSQRVAATLNQGRVLLAGDSAHVNNPIGGMGLNGGIHDAMNLAGKLAAVWKGEADAALLDLYTRQRRKAAVDFTQAQTIANKRLMEERDPAVRARNFDALRRLGDDPAQRRAYMRRAALVESLEAAAQVD